MGEVCLSRAGHKEQGRGSEGRAPLSPSVSPPFCLSFSFHSLHLQLRASLTHSHLLLSSVPGFLSPLWASVSPSASLYDSLAPVPKKGAL